MKRELIEYIEAEDAVDDQGGGKRMSDDQMAVRVFWVYHDPKGWRKWLLKIAGYAP